MRTLPYNFMIFQLIGLWRPVHWAPGWKTNLYNSYTLFIVLFVSAITLFEFVDLIGSIDDLKAFAANSFLLLTMVGVCGKITNFLTKRRELIELTNVLKDYPCLPRNVEEVAIQRKINCLTRFNVLRYAGLAGAAVVAVVLTSVLQDIPRQSLPFNIWLPYDHSSSIGFWIAYLHQILAHVAGAGINIAYDTIVPGLMIETTGQLKILKHRIKKVPEMIDFTRDHETEKSDCTYETGETRALAECVKHHLVIFKFAKEINNVFNFMILIQYTISTIVLCVSVFELSKMKLFSPQFASIVIYLLCMSVQIFQFCFYGNEVTFESISIRNGIYEMDWTELSLETKKSLIVFMICAGMPIKFTSCSVVTLNLDSFNSLVKLSYSAYNVLQRGSQ